MCANGMQTLLLLPLTLSYCYCWSAFPSAKPFRNGTHFACSDGGSIVLRQSTICWRL